MQREQELVERASRDWAAAVASSMDTLIGSIRSDLEVAIADILGPFLESAARAKAIEHLTGLIGEALSNIVNQELEVQAPLELHENLAAALAEKNATVTFIEAPEIAIRVGSQKVRFEELGHQWLLALTGGHA
jgi:hypothetical protein